MITLRQPLTFDECQQVREWRNDPRVTPMLRTGAKTYEEQAAFYDDVICGRQDAHRFYALDYGRDFVGMGGLTHLRRVPGEAEISLIMAPSARGCGLGSAAVDALIVEARRLGLDAIVGECYRAGASGFWAAQIQRYPASLTWQWDLRS